ncbi:TetR-like C-terminal domain-containing protein, partial [Streptomyces sp. YGL11-2]|uniref:TetR-like C-terminal domain-containing protein n=1 Tax=Streptomyces sp. YGL11-2 TaxID=3414028 RepID=UPI003CEA42FA
MTRPWTRHREAASLRIDQRVKGWRAWWGGCVHERQPPRRQGDAARAADGSRAWVAALARAYLDFAARNPAVYDAMFQLDGGLAF